MKKLLQINSQVKSGSTGRIVEQIGNIAMDRGWESFIAYRGLPKKKSNSELITVGTKYDLFFHGLKSRLFDLHGFGSKRATKKLVKKIKKIDPDIISLHNIHGYYLNIEILFKYLERSNKSVFWTLHDCWSFTGHCAYFDLVDCNKWKDSCVSCPCKKSYPKSFVIRSERNFRKKKKIFTGLKNLQLITVSAWLKHNVNQSFLKNYPTHVIRNGVNLSDFYYSSCYEIRKKHKIQNKFVILGVANIWSPRKGLKDFIALSEHLSSDEVILLVGLDDHQIKNLPHNIIGLSKTNSVNELAKYYSMADVYLNPTYQDNFPTTNLEALACGTPVITYNTGGSPEAVDSKTGFVAEKGNIQEVKSYIYQIKLGQRKKFKNKCVRRAEKLFNYKDRYMDYVQLFDKALKKSASSIVQ